jgi:hypothetical protein
MSPKSSYARVPTGPSREHLLDLCLGALLVTLTVAPLALPTVLAADRVSSASLIVLVATLIGYGTAVTILRW